VGLKRNLAYLLISLAKRLLKSNVKVKVYKISSNALGVLLSQSTSKVTMLLYDGVIQYTDFETFKKIIDVDWTKYLEYHLENFDCDNFATTFASHVNEFWNLNNVGVAIGAIKDYKTGKIKGYHAWNVFLAKTTRDARIYVYEPQTGVFTDYEYPRFGDLIYEPHIVIWW